MIGQLLAGLAWQLHGAGLGIWLPTGTRNWSGSTDTRITVGTIPADPDRLITLTPFAPVDDSDGDSTVGVQVRFRGTADRRTVQQPSEAVFDLWQDLGDVEIGGVAVVLINRESSADLGLDSNQRPELSDNYRVRFDRSTTRTD